MAKTITTYLMTDSPNGPQYVLISNKICKMLIVPRAEISIVNSRDEFTTPCLYILLGGEEPNRKAYIGQTESFRKRVTEHIHQKEFWDKALVFISIAGTLTKSDVQYLEYKAIKEAMSSGNYELPNKVIPNKNSMPEHLEEPMNDFFEDVKFFTAFTGCDIFAQRDYQKRTIFYFTARNSAKAMGYLDEETQKFVVLKGGSLSHDCTPSFSKKGKAKRDALAKEICEKQQGFTVLKKDYAFSSPSAAADFLAGNSTNGWDYWKNEQGQSLDEVYRQKK